MKKIQLESKLPTDINRLAGNSYGQEIYNKIKNEITLPGKYQIVFPERIEDIAISFIQGFTSEIFKKISKDQFFEYFEIEGRKKIVDKFKRGVF